MSIAQAAEQQTQKFVELEANNVAQLRKNHPNIEQEPCGREALRQAENWDKFIEALKVVESKHAAGSVKKADFSPADKAFAEHTESFEAYKLCLENNAHSENHSP